MKTIFHKCLIPLLIISAIAVNSYALEVETHKAINEYIAKNSLNGFSVGTYLKNQLGFQDGTDEKFNSLKVWEWIRDGGKYEDIPYWWMPYLRSVNHFHNPLTDQGFSGIWGTDFLTLSGSSAIQWSQWPLGAQTIQVLGSGNYSWYDVRDYFYKALTANDKTTRDNNYAETFRGIGQLMHLVEDMSVPEHTRDDGHYVEAYEAWVKGTGNDGRRNIEIFPITGIIGIRNADLQSFTNVTPIFYDSSSIGNPNPLAPVPFANLFDTNHYDGTNPNLTQQNNIGLSEYTNANFLSPDSKFTSDFPYPNWGSVVEYDATIAGEKRTYLRKLGQSETEGGKVGNGEHIEHLAAGRWGYKLLPSLLKQTGFYLKMDERVYSDYAQKLIPRAVGYSAGLLNYFFRGTLEIAPPDQIAYAVTDGSQTPYLDTYGHYHQQFTSIKAKVRNSTPDTIPGEEVQNCNQIQGNCIIQAMAKYKIIPNYVYDLSNYPPDGATMHNIEYSYSVSEPIYIDSLDSTTPQEFSFDFTNDPIPAGITDLYLQVVFKGTLGNETDIAVAAGMKDLTEPTHQAFWNLTDMFSLNYHLYTSYDNPYTPEIDGIRNTPELANIVDFDHDTVLNPPDTGEPYIDPYPMTFGIGYLSGPPEQGGTFYYSAITTVQPGRHIRLIALMDKPQDNYLVLVQSDAISSTSYFYFTSPGVVNQAVEGIWQTPTPIVTFRYGLDGVIQIPIRQHFKTGVLRCYPMGIDPYGNPACSYPEEEAIPAELSPSPIDDVYYYFSQTVFFDELSTFGTSAIETTGQTGVVVK